MNDTQVKHFIELAKCLNFTKAAQNLYIAQSALSRSIAKLEKELGLELFIRNDKNVRLTPAGSVMIKGYQKLIKEHSDLLQEAIRVDKGDSGSLTVGVLECEKTDYYLPKVMEFFYKSYPGIQIELYQDSFKGIRQNLENGKTDIVLTHLFDLNSYRKVNIAYDTFADVSGRCIVSRKHPLAAYEEVNANDLNGNTMIVISSEVSEYGYNEAVNYMRAQNIKVVIKTADSLHNIMLMVEADLGFALFDSNTKINTDSLKSLPIKEGNHKLSLVAAWDKESYNAAIPIFINCLLKTTESISKSMNN
jgi:DNA-binding transcriptional LysR family regulator